MKYYNQDHNQEMGEIVGGGGRERERDLRSTNFIKSHESECLSKHRRSQILPNQRQRHHNPNNNQLRYKSQRSNRNNLSRQRRTQIQRQMIRRKVMTMI